jgi:hypothetical protein
LQCKGNTCSVAKIVPLRPTITVTQPEKNDPLWRTLTG